MADMANDMVNLADKPADIQASITGVGYPPTLDAITSAAIVDTLTNNAAEWDKYASELTEITSNRAIDHFEIDDFPTMTETISTAPAIPGITSGALNSLMDRIKTVSRDYHPESYFTEQHKKQEGVLRARYSDAISKVQKGVGGSMTANFDAINKTYVTYNEHISSVRDTVYVAYEKEKNAVAGTIKDFIQTKMHTSEENKKLIANFATMMPNSWNGSDVNARVAEFITTPVNMNHVEIRKPTPTIVDNYFKWFILGLVGMLLILTVSIIFRVAMRVRRRRTDE
jgi:hypothetical protein